MSRSASGPPPPRNAAPTWARIVLDAALRRCISAKNAAIFSGSPIGGLEPSTGGVPSGAGSASMLRDA